MLLIILIVLIVLAFGGGLGSRDYRGPGLSLGGLLLLLLLVLWLTGNLNLH